MFTTTLNTKNRPGQRRYRLIALAVGICALAIPASASAFYGTNPGTGGSSGEPAPETLSKDSGLVIPDHTSLNASLNDSSQVSTPNQDSGYSSLSAITGAPGPEPTLVSGSQAADDPFDWGDAALGAGVAMALFTLGGAMALTVRRRTAVSPTA